MRQIKCVRCREELTFLKREKIQLGQTGAFLGDWPNILAGSLEVEIYYCSRCGKIEMFMPGVGYYEDLEEDAQEDLPPEANAGIVGVSMHGVPQVQCPRCGKRHDFDYPKCVYCDYVY